ncbi:MAG: hypothetical protein KHX27_11320 [Alistipes sp.]|jgi:hypothetical protein|uniref:hypothetical protein n=1 Tax=Alistipes sp. TaxID=1872444 RepID=UPI0023F481A9|nr:hypothetical protein [Alistipes sp.]MBS5556979.1 hypothetical protein [Alistipes sp.]
MSTFQERILAASVSPSGNPGNDSEQYRYRTTVSEEYLAAHDYRVRSTELPEQFLVWWMRPVGRNAAEQRRLEREFHSDDEYALVHIPLEIFMTAYYERYERCKGPASFLSADRASTQEDADAVEALFADDADYRAQAGAFIESFHKFQTLLRYIFTLHTIGFADKLRRFDLFDVEAYDEVLAQVNRDLTDGTIPPFEARIV